MRTILNIIWLLFAGIPLVLAYVLVGAIACVFIITIPAGIACFRMAGYALWPFGRTVVSDPRAGAMSAVSNVIWFVIAGLWLAVSHAVTAMGLALTIIGIPMAIANLKMIPVTCFPFGKVVVSTSQMPANYTQVEAFQI